MRLLLAVTGVPAVFASLCAMAAMAHAQPARDWALWTRASAQGGHSAAGQSEGTAALELAGHAQQGSDWLLPLRDPQGEVATFGLLPVMGTGGALRLAGGSHAPLLGATHWAKAEVFDLGLPTDVLGDGYALSLASLDVSHQLDWQIQPALSRRRDLWRRPYTREEVGFVLRSFALTTPRSRFAVFDFGMGVAHARQHDGSMVAVQTEYLTDIVFFTWRRARPDTATGMEPDFALDILAVSSRGLDRDQGDAVIGDLHFARMRGLSLGHGVFADASVGVGGTGTMTVSVTDENGNGTGTTITTEDLPLMSTGVGNARIQAVHGSFDAAVQASRQVYLTIDTELAVEDRLGGQLGWHGEHGSLSLEAFAARTHVWPDKDTETPETDVTGGASAVWSRRIADDTELGVSVEVARSFYASLAADARPRAELTTRGAIHVTRHLARAP